MMSDVFALFDDEATPEPTPPARVMMSDSQRSEIRALFTAMDITSAVAQFAYVEDATGVQLRSVSELDAATAQILINRLRGRATTHGKVNSGSSWDNRTEDTWIDRL